jgi:hypothetical protein
MHTHGVHFEECDAEPSEQWERVGLKKNGVGLQARHDGVGQSVNQIHILIAAVERVPRVGHSNDGPKCEM